MLKRRREELALEHFERGIAWHHKGDYDRAIQDFNKAIKLRPDCAEAYILSLIHISEPTRPY